MLLLGMRMLVCALVAVAFARPFFGKKEETTGLAAKHARVIVADVSASMNWGSAAAKLKSECERVITELSEGSDAVGLVMMGGGEAVEIDRNFDAVRAAAKEIKPGQGAGDIAGALEVADGMLRNVQAAMKDIVLISDLQRSGWNRRVGGELRKLAGDVKLTVIPVVGTGETGGGADVMIVDRYCPESVVMDGTLQSISVKVANLSGKELSDLPVKLTITNATREPRDGNPRPSPAETEQKINIKAGGTMLVRFTHVFDAVGDTPMVVRVGSDESITPENTVYFNTRVMGRIPVVILNGAPSANRAADGAFFLGLALSPKGSPPFEVKVVDASIATPEDIKTAAVVFLADVDKLPTGMNQSLTELLQRGGGVMFLPGENVSANVFNSQFGELAPCRLRGVLEGSKEGVSFSKLDFGHAIFREFAMPNHGDFSGVRFYRWWDVRDYQGAVNGEESRVLARFDDGRPALLERQVGRGQSLLLASSTDLRWTNFAEKAAVFQPFVHLAAKSMSIRTEPRTAYVVGEELPIPEGGEKLKVRSQKPEVDTLQSQGAGVVARRAGFYAVVDKGGNDVFVYAVNVDSSEMDRAVVSADEIISAMEQPRDEEMGVATDRAAAVEKDGGHLWWYVILAVAMLFAMELFVANRTLRH
ncbi:MAG: VWA domain-containing protein, partial [Phycisphaerales bacterium]|nr:VWA domain-containing protein [Phycisphaerales bacterium]